LARPNQREKNRGRIREEEEERGKCPLSGFSSLEEERKERERKREAWIKRGGNANELHVPKIWKKSKCTRVGKKRAREGCDGGGDDVTLGDGVSTKIREGRFPPHLGEFWRLGSWSKRVFIQGTNWKGRVIKWERKHYGLRWSPKIWY
jgi:hypothetical protein